MFINWDVVTTRFDPNSLVPSTQPPLHGIPVPSYGNYGGINYSAGQEGGTTPESGSDAYNANPPLDSLDELFYTHDLHYQHLQYGTETVEQTWVADAQLIEGMYNLAQSGALASDPEALLYDAFATIGILGKILDPSSPELAFLQTNLPVAEQQIVFGLAPAAVKENFENGLADTPGEARSLHGALHVFEAHFADLLFA